MAGFPTNNETLGEKLSTTNAVLTTGASALQDFSPLKNVCAHLHAYHAYANEPGRAVEANHYCGHVNDEVRQCLLYDSAESNARLIGIEYMITPRLFETLPADERKLWHSHVYEVKSGMLIMPNKLAPDAIWEVAETKEMEQVIKLYGKVYHLWQTDKGHKLPLGEPQLMTSFISEEQFDTSKLQERDEKYGVKTERKQQIREHIPSPEIHPDADQTWK